MLFRSRGAQAVVLQQRKERAAAGRVDAVQVRLIAVLLIVVAVNPAGADGVVVSGPVGAALNATSCITHVPALTKDAVAL